MLTQFNIAMQMEIINANGNDLYISVLVIVNHWKESERIANQWKSY